MEHFVNKTPRGRSIVRLAIDYSTWHERTGGDFEFPMANLKYMGVEELLLVVGNLDVFDMERNFTFVTPYGLPYQDHYIADTAV